MFQFHIGAIKRGVLGTFVVVLTTFQFHIGAIKSQIFTCKINKLYYFINKFICQPPIALKSLTLDDINFIYIKLSVIFFSIPIISRPAYFRLPSV